MRALAKRPEDRFQSAAELAGGLAAAAEGAPLTGATAAAAAAAILDTERIGSPTSPNEPARTTTVVGGDDDEATVVGTRPARTAPAAVVASTPTGEELPPPIAPLPEPAFNPWRIAVPAIAAVAIIFAVFFAFQRRGVSSEQQNQPPLQADPNGQPVQPITPPTGQAESNLAPASGTPTPSAPTGDGGVLPVGGAPDANANVNPNPAATPTPEGGKPKPTPEATPEEEEEEPPPVPTPTPRRNKPLPNINANVGPPPPPKPDKPKEDEPDKPPALNDAPPGPAVKPL
jgi:serine/threonine-protein kinase